MCGTLTGSNATGPENNGRHENGINTFELQEDLKSRNIRATVTDYGMAHIGETLAAMLADRIPAKSRTTQRITQHVDTTPPLLAPTVEASAIIPQAPAASTDRERLQQIFEYEGEEVRLQEDDLKAVSGQDYARRLTYLFVLCLRASRS